MTTSGVSVFTQPRNNIIKAALRKVGAIKAGETVNQNIITDCSIALNAMVKSWEAIGIHLWTETQSLLFTVPGQVRYALGPNTPDHITPDYQYSGVQVVANLTPGVSSIPVTDVAGIQVGYQFGVMQADGRPFWSIVDNVVPSTNTVIMHNPTTDFVLNGNPAYYYKPAVVVRPLRIPFAQRRQMLPTPIDTPMIRLARKDYWELPNKQDTGTITQFFYDPQNLDGFGYLYLWPAPVDTDNNCVMLTWYRPIQNFETAANTPDFPDEWTETLIFNLAKSLAPEFDCPAERYAIIVQRADELLDLLKGWDREPESVNFGVDFSQMQGGMS